MSDNDKDIQAIVEQQAAEGAYDPAREGILRDVLISNFRGRMRAASIISLCCVAAFATIAVYAGVQFFLTAELGEKVLYSALFVSAMMFVVTVKLWYWMLANRNGLQREIKRLELRVAELSEKLTAK